MRPRLNSWAVLAAPMALFLLAPMLGLSMLGHRSVGLALQSDETLAAVSVSLRTTLCSLILIVAFGTPLAVALAHGRSRWTRLVDALVDLPLVLPPAAAGIGLLLAFGRQGLMPSGLAFTGGAVVAAQIFVAAPFYIRAASSAFRRTSPELEETAVLEGANTFGVFHKVVLPLSAGPVCAGAIVAWARALGEFGATILFAGNIVGKTQTMPLAIYLGFEQDLDRAIGLSVVLLLVAFVILATARWLGLERSQP